MNASNKTRKILTLVFAAAALATGYFASVSASDAGWIYGPHGYVYCNYANAVEWCN